MKLIALLQVILLLMMGQGPETYDGGVKRLFSPIDWVIGFITSGSRDAAQPSPESYAAEETEEAEEAGENTPEQAVGDTDAPASEGKAAFAETATLAPEGTARPTETPEPAPEEETPSPMPGTGGDATAKPTEPAEEPTSLPTEAPTPTRRPGGGSTGSGENETGMMGGF